MSCCLLPIAIYFSEPEFTSVVCYLSGFSMGKERKSLCVASHGEMTSAWRINRRQESVFSLPGNEAVIVIKWDSPVSDRHHPVHQESPHKNDFSECFLRRVFKRFMFSQKCINSIKATVWKRQHCGTEIGSVVARFEGGWGNRRQVSGYKGKTCGISGLLKLGYDICILATIVDIKLRWGLPWWLSGKESFLTMQETQVWSLVQEDPTCCRATKPVGHNYWTCGLQPKNWPT